MFCKKKKKSWSTPWVIVYGTITLVPNFTYIRVNTADLNKIIRRKCVNSRLYVVIFRFISCCITFRLRKRFPRYLKWFCYVCLTTDDAIVDLALNVTREHLASKLKGWIELTSQPPEWKPTWSAQLQLGACMQKNCSGRSYINAHINEETLTRM